VDFQPAEGAEPLEGYCLERQLGAGGCGQVWCARRPDGGQMALKFIPLNSTAGRVELKALKYVTAIRHPNLVSLFGSWQVDRFLMVGMELADGTLFDCLQKSQSAGRTGIPIDELMEYLSEAARGLDFLNSYHHPHPDGSGRLVSFQHRDIKPRNLLLFGGGVKVGDWGLIRMLEDLVAGHTGHMTPEYAPPEFFHSLTSSTSDQYSLAVTYYVLRTGKLPRPFNPGLLRGRREQEVLERALHLNPYERWPSCRDFVEALRTAVRPTSEPATAVLGAAARDGELGVPQFHYGSVVPPQHFIDRESELAEARRAIDAGQSFLIVGKHRVGKTSFCKKLIHEVMGGAGNQTLAVYVNLQSCIDLNNETFLAHTLLALLGEIARQVFGCKSSDMRRPQPADANPLLKDDRVFESFAHIYRLVEDRTHSQGNVAPAPLRPAEFVQFTQELLDLVRRRGWSNFVIVYDEANRLPRDLSVDLLVSNEQDLNAAGVISVYVASPEMADAFAPLFQTFGRELRLGPFPSIQELRRLLACYYFNDPERTADVPVAAEALEMLWNRTRGQPYLIQLLAGRSFALANQEKASAVQAHHVAAAHEALKLEKRLALAED
jgi:serine/threonine protein kinase